MIRVRDLKIGEQVIVGDIIYEVCEKCLRLARFDDPTIGSFHICIDFSPEAPIAIEENGK